MQGEFADLCTSQTMRLSRDWRKERRGYFDRLRFVCFFGFEGCAPGRGISGVGFTFRSAARALSVEVGVWILFPRFAM